MSNSLEEELDIAPVAVIEEQGLVEVPSEDERDYEYARQNIYSAIETAMSALQDLNDLAKSSQAARSYEVLATLTRTIIDAQHQLLELKKRKIEVDKLQGNEPQAGPTTINNNLILTTAQLGRMIENMAKNKDEDLPDVSDSTYTRK